MARGSAAVVGASARDGAEVSEADKTLEQRLDRLQRTDRRSCRLVGGTSTRSTGWSPLPPEGRDVFSRSAKGSRFSGRADMTSSGKPAMQLNGTHRTAAAAASVRGAGTGGAGVCDDLAAVDQRASVPAEASNGVDGNEDVRDENDENADSSMSAISAKAAAAVQPASREAMNSKAVSARSKMSRESVATPGDTLGETRRGLAEPRALGGENDAMAAAAVEEARGRGGGGDAMAADTVDVGRPGSAKPTPRGGGGGAVAAGAAKEAGRVRGAPPTTRDPQATRVDGPTEGGSDNGLGAQPHRDRAERRTAGGAAQTAGGGGRAEGRAGEGSDDEPAHRQEANGLHGRLSANAPTRSRAGESLRRTARGEGVGGGHFIRAMRLTGRVHFDPLAGASLPG